MSYRFSHSGTQGAKEKKHKNQTPENPKQTFGFAIGSKRCGLL